MVPQPGVNGRALPLIRMLLARVKTRQDDQRAGQLNLLSMVGQILIESRAQASPLYLDAGQKFIG